jgi:hypothetical protein
VAITHGVGPVALQAVIVVNELARCNSFRMPGKRIRTPMVLSGDVFPAGTRRCAQRNGYAQGYREKLGKTTLHRAPPFPPRNRLPIWLTSKARPMR